MSIIKQILSYYPEIYLVISGIILTMLDLPMVGMGVFGIVGIILRLLKKDLLDQRMNYAADSYWIKKEQMDFNQNHYTRQF